MWIFFFFLAGGVTLEGEEELEKDVGSERERREEKAYGEKNRRDGGFCDGLCPWGMLLRLFYFVFFSLSIFSS